MKLTINQLRRIIKEEIGKTFSESAPKKYSRKTLGVTIKNSLKSNDWSWVETPEAANVGKLLDRVLGPGYGDEFYSHITWATKSKSPGQNETYRALEMIADDLLEDQFVYDNPDMIRQ